MSDPKQLSKSDREALKRAVEYLEDISLEAKLADHVGDPIEKQLEALPKVATGKINEITNVALRKAVQVAILGMKRGSREASRKALKAAVTVSGGVGGFFGLPALSLELPISTTLILRSIADIARSEGEDPQDLKTQIACVEVFALGGSTKSDDAAETAPTAAHRSAVWRMIRSTSSSLVSDGCRRRMRSTWRITSSRSRSARTVRASERYISSFILSPKLAAASPRRAPLRRGMPPSCACYG